MINGSKRIAWPIRGAMVAGAFGLAPQRGREFGVQLGAA